MTKTYEITFNPLAHDWAELGAIAERLTETGTVTNVTIPAITYQWEADNPFDAMRSLLEVENNLNCDYGERYSFPNPIVKRAPKAKK